VHRWFHVSLFMILELNARYIFRWLVNIHADIINLLKNNRICDRCSLESVLLIGQGVWVNFCGKSKTISSQCSGTTIPKTSVNCSGLLWIRTYIALVIPYLHICCIWKFICTFSAIYLSKSKTVSVVHCKSFVCCVYLIKFEI